MQIVVACAENIDAQLITDSTGRKDLKIVKGYTYDLLKHSYFGIIKSGTSTLETGYMRLPFIVVYSTNSLTYVLGKLVVKIKNIAMANIILGKTVVKELIQKDVNAGNIYNCAAEVISDKVKYELVKNELSLIKDKLGKPGSSAKAAKIIFEAVNEA
jgi:lipid-A-disaccharide synthase